MEYEDKNAYAAMVFYACPNEGTSDWRNLIKGTPLFRAAGICSSGEVGFFSILPSVRKKLVLVDHSYGSLHVAITKYLLLLAKGPKEVHRLFTTAAHQEIADACAEVQGDLPKEVREANHSRYDLHWCTMVLPRQEYDYRTNQYTTRDKVITDNVHMRAIQAHWRAHISLDLVRQAYKKLHLVKFIHGDLQDLADEGPFGLIYLSNALEHVNRDRRQPALDHVKACLRPKGLVVVAGRAHSDPWARNKRVYDYTTHQYMYPNKDAKPLVEVKTCTGTGNIAWKQALYQFSQEVVST